MRKASVEKLIKELAKEIFYSMDSELIERVKWLEEEDKKFYGKWYALKEDYDKLKKNLTADPFIARIKENEALINKLEQENRPFVRLWEEIAELKNKIEELRLGVHVSASGTSEESKEEPPLPCPFCGEDPEVMKTTHPKQFTVGCSNRGCQVTTAVSAKDREQAIKLWNHRAGQA